jgi:hypothetical protein
VCKDCKNVRNFYIAAWISLPLYKTDNLDLYMHNVSEYADRTECYFQVVRTPASYSGGPGFRSLAGDQLSCLIFFMVLPSPSS